MHWNRPARLPVLTAWAVFLAVLIYLGGRTELYAPQLSNLVGRHLLRLEDSGLRVRDFRVWGLDGVDLYGVSLTVPGSGRGQVLVTADTVQVDYVIKEALADIPRFRRVVVRRPEIFVRADTDSGKSDKEKKSVTAPKLPTLIIDDLLVSLGYLELADAGGRVQERIPYLSWRGSVEAGPVTRAVLRDCAVDWQTTRQPPRQPVRRSGPG
ncbi:MAG: hypothetical protein IPH86_15385 [bacterium]|nr:hypothetical protein [bacterium]